MLDPDDIATVMATIRVLWPHTPIPDAGTEPVVALWRTILGDATRVEVADAITYLATHGDRGATGREYPPPVGVIRARVDAARRHGRVVAALAADDVRHGRPPFGTLDTAMLRRASEPPHRS